MTRDLALEENLPQGRKFRELIQLLVTVFENACASCMRLEKSSWTVKTRDGHRSCEGDREVSTFL